jgi:hypothetical protein
MANWKRWAIEPLSDPDCSTPSNTRLARYRGKECTWAIGGGDSPQLQKISQACEQNIPKKCLRIDTVNFKIVSG